MKQSTTPPNRLLLLREHADERGRLTTLPTGAPIEPRRAFWIHSVPSGAGRGCHAHRSCHELLVAVSGSFKVKVSADGKTFHEYTLQAPCPQGLLVRAMEWCELFDFSAGAICLCLASEDYDAGGYIHSLEEFTAAVAATPLKEGDER